MKQVKIKASDKIVCITPRRAYIDKAGNEVIYHPVYETVNYGIFHFLEMNRATPIAHIRCMGESITEIGLVEVIKVCVFEMKYYVIDGQNRYKYLESAGLPIPFVLIELDSLDAILRHMILVNSSAKKWTLNNYIDANATLGKPSYCWLKGTVSKFTNSGTAAIFANISIALAKDKIKDGSYTIDNKAIGEKRLFVFRTFFNRSKIHPGQRAIEGLIYFVNSISFAMFAEHHANFADLVRVTECPNLFKKELGAKDYENIFNDMYKLYLRKK